MTRINPSLPEVIDFSTNDEAAYVVSSASLPLPEFFIIGGNRFVWPGGTEGFRLFGGATISEHKYLGDNELIVNVTHLDAARIEMSGVFPGMTGMENMRALRKMAMLPNPPSFKRLYLPGIYPIARRVIAESYDFGRQPNSTDIGDYGASYTMTFVLVGTVTRLDTPQTDTESQPSSGSGRGSSAHIFTVRDGARTLRQIADVVYGNSKSWPKLYHLNAGKFSTELPPITVATKILPIGMKLRY